MKIGDKIKVEFELDFITESKGGRQYAFKRVVKGICELNIPLINEAQIKELTK